MFCLIFNGFCLWKNQINISDLIFQRTRNALSYKYIFIFNISTFFSVQLHSYVYLQCSWQKYNMFAYTEFVNMLKLIFKSNYFQWSSKFLVPTILVFVTVYYFSQNLPPELAPKKNDIKAESSQPDVESQLPPPALRKSSVVQFRKDGSLDYDGKLKHTITHWHLLTIICISLFSSLRRWMRVRPINGVARQRDDAPVVTGQNWNGPDQSCAANIHFGTSIPTGNVRRLLCPSGSVFEVRNWKVRRVYPNKY